MNQHKHGKHGEKDDKGSTLMHAHTALSQMHVETQSLSRSLLLLYADAHVHAH